MSKDAQFRFDRIKKLVNELSYEVERGIYEEDIEPDMSYRRMIASVGSNSNPLILEVRVYECDRYANPRYMGSPAVDSKLHIKLVDKKDVIRIVPNKDK